ncbi:MAG: hypothetical protein HKN85_01000 [Gammaproteobacteria bacterium]|nr:hypothetical protein [Gammaproteobacteria bacterium]
MPSSTLLRWLPVLLLLALTVCIGAYYPGLSGEYLFDDLHVIQTNKLLRIPSLAPEFVIPAMESFTASGRQLSMFSFALNFYFFGDSTWWLKFINLLIHCLNGITIYILLKTICHKLAGDTFQSKNSFPEYLAAVTAAIWLVHPINLTSVLYLSQRMTLLSSFFILTGLIFYIYARTRIRSPLRKLVYLPLGILAFTLTGFACKENAALLPLFIFVVELILFRFKSNGKIDREVATIFVGGFLLVALAIGYKFLQRPDWIISGYSSRHFTLEERVLTQFRALIFYIQQILLPSNFSLGLWHDDFQLSKGLLHPVSTLASGIGLLALLVCSIVTLFRLPMVSLGIMWFFVAHAIESTIIPLEIMHEHRNYLASMGIVLSLVCLLDRLLRSRKLILTALFGCIFAYDSVVLAQRSNIWSNNFRLFEHEAMAHPDSAIATFQLGVKYYEDLVRGNAESGARVFELFSRSAALESRAINGELGLVVASEYDSVDYNPDWINRAARKLKEFPKEVSSQSAMMVYLRCLSDGKCKQSEADADILFGAAYDTGYFRLRSLAATYYAGVGNDMQKAEKGFATSLTSGDALTWINYLAFLLRLQKDNLACEIYQEFDAKWNRGEFQNTAQNLGHASNLKKQLAGCRVKAEQS